MPADWLFMKVVFSLCEITKQACSHLLQGCEIQGPKEGINGVQISVQLNISDYSSRAVVVTWQSVVESLFHK